MAKLKSSALVLMLLVLALSSGCGITGSRGNGDDNYFSAYHTFDDQQWSYAEPVELRVDTLRDSIARGGALILSLRHTAGYQYSNLWLELQYAYGDSVGWTDTLNVILSDVYGHWLGHGSGPSLQFNDTIAKHIDMHRGATMRLRHIMRLDTLPNIEQIGLVYLP